MASTYNPYGQYAPDHEGKINRHWLEREIDLYNFHSEQDPQSMVDQYPNGYFLPILAPLNVLVRLLKECPDLFSEGPDYASKMDKTPQEKEEFSDLLAKLADPQSETAQFFATFIPWLTKRRSKEE